MKKVLALVLAVIMVCTMAMATTVEAVTVSGVTSDTNFGKITLADKYDATKTYVLNLKDDFFKVLDAYLTVDGKAPARDAKNFKVEGVNGAFGVDATDKTTKVFAITVDNTDRALDGKVDMTINTLKITSVKKTNTYAEYVAKDGKLILNKLVLGGVSKDVTTAGFTADFWAAYDIGYKTLEATDTNFNWSNEGWFITGKNGFESVNGGVSLKVPANTTFKFSLAASNLTNLGTVIPSTLTVPTSVAVEGYKVTAGTLTYKVVGDTNDYFYGVDKDGKLYASGLTFSVVKDVNGNETGYWTMTTTDARDIIKTNGAVPGVAGTTAGSTGTTTNPGTGANDIVGVAAALAVVALVSGAAISLKK